MTTPTRHMEQEEVKRKADSAAALPVIADDLPVMYEDEGQDEMGESKPHTRADQILSLGLEEHLRPRAGHQVFSNLNLYYHPTDRRAYVSPDVMVVHTTKPLPEDISSYRLGPDRPAPILVIEILSKRSFQQQDLTNKPVIYGKLGVAEYILVDGTGQLLTDRLLLKRRIDDEAWEDMQDRDGGVTSQLGFRILIEDDELPRVYDLATGRAYLRPQEAPTVVRVTEDALKIERAARVKLEDRVRELEAELKRLTGQRPEGGEKA